MKCKCFDVLCDIYSFTETRMSAHGVSQTCVLFFKHSFRIKLISSSKSQLKLPCTFRNALSKIISHRTTTPSLSQA